MTYDPRKHHRRSIRLRGYNYSGGGAYFITICVQDKECLFGQVVDSEMTVNQAGQIVERVWHSLPRRFPAVVLDSFQIMPNHLHGILAIPGSGLEPSLAVAMGVPKVGVGLALPPSHEPDPKRQGTASRTPTGLGLGAASRTPTRGQAMGDVVGALKSIATIEVNHLLSRTGRRLLQENFYEHIVRSVESLERIRAYIRENPACWLEDPEHPDRAPSGIIDDRFAWL